MPPPAAGTAAVSVRVTGASTWPAGCAACGESPRPALAGRLGSLLPNSGRDSRGTETMHRNRLFFLSLIAFAPALASADLAETLKEQAQAAEPQVIEWRRHFHEHPELSNREFETAEKVAEELRAMGLEVETGIAHTGIIAHLEGGKPGPLVALRADMDALPVTERVELPFASKAKGTYRGRGGRDARRSEEHTSELQSLRRISY